MLLEGTQNEVLYTFALCMVGLYVAGSAKESRFIMLSTALLVAGIAYIWHSKRQRDTGRVDDRRSMKALADYASVSPGRNLDTQWYNLRRMSPESSAPLRHLSMRKEAIELVSVMRRYAKRERGKVGRVLACLEDFFCRYDRALLSDDPEFVAQVLPILMDTRADALNTLASLTFALPSASSPFLEKATYGMRDITQACIATLATKFKEHPSVNARRDWRPPYPTDDRFDAHYSLFA